MTESTDETLAAASRWVYDTCLLFGAQPEMAAHVAGHFAEGVRKAWAEEEADRDPA